MVTDTLVEIGETIANTRSIDPRTMTFEEAESIFEFASDLYEAGHYDKATPLFQTVATFCPLEYKNWFGLGACLQMEARYEEALTAWSVAASMQEEADPYVHAAECFLSLQQKDQALNALSIALTKLKEPSAKIEGMLSLIQGEIK